MQIKTVSEQNIDQICRELAARDADLARVYEMYGVPPLWERAAGFATLLQIILEQQVSLASAKACYDKLAARLGEVTPDRLLTLTDAELRFDGFSRQKTAYARNLAEAMISKQIDLDALTGLPDEAVRSELIRLKGIGTWTADIYLLMALLRPDVMPKGDIALHTAWHRLSGEPRPHSDQFLDIAQRWSPYRSVAARLLWHFYLSEKAAVRKAKS